MRHLFLAVAMVIGALVATSVATTALEHMAAARAPAANDYQPPSLVASPSSYSKKTDGVMSGVQRARPRVIVNPDAANPDGRV